MKKKLSLLAVVASAMTACDESPQQMTEEEIQAAVREETDSIAKAPEEKHCVDSAGNYVDDKICEGGEALPTGAPVASADPKTVTTVVVHDSTGRVIYVPHGYYHPVYVPYGYYGGVGSPAGVYHTSVTPGSGRTAAISAIGASRGGYVGGFASSSARAGFGGSAHGFSSGG